MKYLSIISHKLIIIFVAIKLKYPFLHNAYIPGPRSTNTFWELISSAKFKFSRIQAWKFYYPWFNFQYYCMRSWISILTSRGRWRFQSMRPLEFACVRKLSVNAQKIVQIQTKSKSEQNETATFLKSGGRAMSTRHKILGILIIIVDLSISVQSCDLNADIKKPVVPLHL